MKQIVVVGAGAAGLMAAATAAAAGCQVTVLEKMSSPGRKLLITGKGRCNLTNARAIEDLIANMPGNGRFLHSAYKVFGNTDLISWMEERGLPTKVERGGRVFPVSDKARDVVDTLTGELARRGVRLLCGRPAKQLLSDGYVTGIATEQEIFPAQAVIIATGGASYPGTGSSGDGYKLAIQAGHSIIPIKPSLVPLEVGEDWVKELQGLSLRNVSATVYESGKKIADDFGEMLFTHYGLSGPIILSLSKYAAQSLDKGGDVTLAVNLKPALREDILDKRLQRDWEKFSRKQLKNSLHELLPHRLIPVVIDLAYLDADKFVHQITKTERLRLVKCLQALTFTITSTRPVSEAIVTAGGVNIKEIMPATMQSKRMANLYFAGEVLDIDGYTGGFNLQAAFSTGYVAGRAAAE